MQIDAVHSASYLVHDMSRGTKSEERAIAIDEARDVITDEVFRLTAESRARKEKDDSS